MRHFCRCLRMLHRFCMCFCQRIQKLKKTLIACDVWFMWCACVGFDFCVYLHWAREYLKCTWAWVVHCGAHQKHPGSKNKKNNSQRAKINRFCERFWQHLQSSNRRQINVFLHAMNCHSFVAVKSKCAYICTYT